MTARNVFGSTALAGLACLFVLTFVLSTCAKAEQCPEGAKSCKILVIVPEQEEALKLLISNTALQGPYNQVKGAVDFYLDLLAKAPAGTVKVADPVKPAPVADPPKP